MGKLTVCKEIFRRMYERSRVCLIYLRTKRDRFRETKFYRYAMAGMPYLGTLIFSFILFLAILRHEMWRDELQAWLLSRGASTPWELMQIIKYEGHPGLWHLIIWPIARLWDNPMGMQICHMLIASGTVFLLYRFAPFHWILRFLISYGYFFVYEWGVISRNYAIAGLLLFGICALYKERWRFLPYIAVLIFLLCHANIGGIIVSIILFGMLMIDFAVAYAGRFRGADKYFKRCILAFIIIFSGIATGIIQINPPEDSGYATNWFLKRDDKVFVNRTKTVVDAFAPLPRDTAHFWNSNRLVVANGKADKTWYEVERDDLPKAAGLILLLAFLMFFKRPWMGLQFLFVTLGMFTFFYIKYLGGLRHCGIIYLMFLVSFWMSFYYNPWRLKWRIPEKILAAFDRYRGIFLIPLLLIQIWAAWVAVKNDWEHPFSAAKEAAVWLKNEFSEEEIRQRFIYAGTNDPVCSSLCGYLYGIPFYYTQRGEYGTYVIWDKKRSQNSKKNLYQGIRELMAEEKKDCIMVLERKISDIPPNCRFLNNFGGGIVGESYYLYLWEYKGE